jgi:hypothetical protein
MSQYQTFAPSKGSNVQSSTCCGAIFFKRFLAVVGESVLLSFITLVDEEFHYEWP